MSKKIGRNEPCPCGSGIKYKKCCLNPQARKPATPVPQKTKFVPVFTPLDKLSNSVIQLIDQNKFDKAEKACHKLMKKYPDQIDGLHRFAQLYETRGENEKAVDFYLKAADFAKADGSFDQGSIDMFLDEAKRLQAIL